MQPHRDRVGAEGLDVPLGQLHRPLVEIGSAGLLDRADDVGGASPSRTACRCRMRSSPGSSTVPRPSSAVFSSLACSMPRTVLISRARRIASAWRSAPWLATIASPRGSRIVAPVAVLDLDGVAGRTEVVDLGGKNQFHLWCLSFSPAGSARRRAERQQRDLAGVLDRDRDVALVLHAVTGHPTGADLAALADVGAQQRGVLVIDRSAPSWSRTRTCGS